MSGEFPAALGNHLLNIVAKNLKNGAFGVWVTIAFLALVFLLGGGARADLFSLVVLRPLAALALTYGVWQLSRQKLRDYRVLFLLAASILALCLIHLLPLPSAVWAQLPGRGIVSQIDATAGLSLIWRPLTLVPPDGWNAAFSLMVPFAVLVLAVELSDLEQRHLAFALVCIAFASILLGLLQLQGSSHGPAYFYRITNEGKMVGLFANRNHNAILLAVVIPIFGYAASLPVRDRTRLKIRLALTLFGAMSLVTALVIIGSRAGFVFGVLGALAAVAIYRSPKVLARRHSDSTKQGLWARQGKFLIFGAIGVIALCLFAFSQSETMQRVQGTDRTEELRLKVVGPVLDMAWSYFPFGSGIGSFVETYKMDEPMALLAPYYLNHAHDDLLETALTAGLPGLLIVGLGVFAWAVASRRAFSRRAPQDENTLRARLGAVIIGILALASLVDYPLRTPSLASVFVIASVWLARGTALRIANRKTENA